MAGFVPCSPIPSRLELSFCVTKKIVEAEEPTATVGPTGGGARSTRGEASSATVDGVSDTPVPCCPVPPHDSVPDPPDRRRLVRLRRRREQREEREKREEQNREKKN